MSDKHKQKKDIDEILKTSGDPKATLKELKAKAEKITAPRRPQTVLSGKPQDPPQDCLSFKSFKVLGENHEGRVLFWSIVNRKVYTHDLKSLQYDQLVQIGGVEIVKKVGRGKRYDQPGDEGSLLLPFPEVKTRLIVEASKRQLGELFFFGQGIHTLRDGERLLVVNGGHGWIWNGDNFQMQDHPMIDGRLIDWNSGKKWIDFNPVRSMVKGMTTEVAVKTVDEVCTLIDQWGFCDPQDTYLLSGWMLAQVVQSVWSWRPHLWLSGPAGSGKTMLISLLEGLAGPLAMRREGKSLTEAGFRQDMGNNGVQAFIDEFEKSDHRDALIEYLRSASRGGTIAKGTSAQKAVHFWIQHMVLLASIEYRLARAAERSRFLIVELVKDNARHPIIPNAEKLEELRVRIYAFAIWASFKAKSLIRQLGRIPGYEDRLVESYAVPLSMITLCRENALELLRNMVTAYLDKAHKMDMFDHITDEEKLIRDISFAKIRIPVEQRNSEDKASFIYKESSISQVVSKIQEGSADGLFDEVLQAHGIKITEEGFLFLIPDIVTRKLLRDTPWGDLNIEPILKRINGSIKTRRRIAARLSYGILIPVKDRLVSEHNSQ